LFKFTANFFHPEKVATGNIEHGFDLETAQQAWNFRENNASLV